MNVLRRIRSLCRDEDGQALVELALVLPLLLIIIFAIIDFGLALNQENSTDNIANIAVRQTAVIGTTPTVTLASSGTCATVTTIGVYVSCEKSSTGATIGSNCQVTVTDISSATPTTGDSIKITVSSTFNWLSILSGGAGGIGGLGNLPSTISQSATMRLEQTPSATNNTNWFPSTAQSC